MKQILVFFLAFILLSCHSAEQQRLEVDPPQKKANPEPPPVQQKPAPKQEIKNNLRDIKIQQKDIYQRLEKLDKKIKMRKKRLIKSENLTCIEDICFEGDNE